jgi:N-acyl-D-aspartate/D-glutamate deacylase
VDALIDLALADDLQTVVEAPLSNLDEDEESVRALVTAPSTLIGLGDAGAHVKSITNYTYPTHVLGQLAHRRQWLSVADAVRRMTSVPAAVMGIAGRGVLEVGAAADINVIDLDRLEAEPARLVADLPGGAKRLHAGARGYRAVLVNGEVAVREDVVMNSTSGTLVRVAS